MKKIIITTILILIIFCSKAQNWYSENFGLGKYNFLIKQYSFADSLFSKSLSYLSHPKAYYYKAKCNLYLGDLKNYYYNLLEASILGDSLSTKDFFNTDYHKYLKNEQNILFHENTVQYNKIENNEFQIQYFINNELDYAEILIFENDTICLESNKNNSFPENIKSYINRFQNNKNFYINKIKNTSVTEIIYCTKTKDDSTKNGLYVSKYKNIIQIIGTYNNNQRNGKWIFRPSKRFKINANYQNDKEDGQWLYSDNGIVVAAINYKNGLKHGKSLSIYSNGKKNALLNYQFGKLEGTSFIYYPNGHIKQKIPFEKGVPHGLYQFYDKNDSVFYEVKFYYGLPFDIKTNKNIDTSKTYITGNLKKGNGQIIYYGNKRYFDFKDGYVPMKPFKLLELNFKNGQMDGFCEGYNEFEQKIFEGYFQNGCMVGNWTFHKRLEGVKLSKTYKYNPKIRIDSTMLPINFFIKNFFGILELNPRFYSNDYGDISDYIIDTKTVRSNDGKLLTGKVSIMFTVSETGEIKNIIKYKTNNQLLDNECIQIIQNMPLWIPCLMNGMPYPTTFRIPFVYD